MRKLIKEPQLHPLTWWGLSVAFLILATSGVNATYLLAISLFCVTGVLLWREPKNLKLYLVTALVITITRLTFALIFSTGSDVSLILLTLPQASVQLGPIGEIKLLGPLHLQTLLIALQQSLKLTTMVLVVALANSMAHPRRLLQFTPAALYGFAAVLGIAFNLLPQLIRSIERVSNAQLIKQNKKPKFTQIVIPVLEDAIDSSLALAASMDSRGFGKRIPIPAPINQFLKLNSAFTLLCIICASWLMIISPANSALVWIATALAVISFSASLKISHKYKFQTRSAPLPLRRNDYVVIGFAAFIFSCLPLGILAHA